MKIVAINGSPRGRASTTGVMVDAFLKGAAAVGAQTNEIYLTEKDIRYCRGCHSCWSETPGKCVIDDDMASVLAGMAGVDVIVLASPLFFSNISGTLKVFMDRLTVTGNPHARGDAPDSAAGGAPAGGAAPRLLMISNCGYPDRSQFEVISLWIKRVAAMMGTAVIAEIYATQGRLLSQPPPQLKEAAAAYLHDLERAGSEIASGGKLSAETGERLQRDLTP